MLIDAVITLCQCKSKLELFVLLDKQNRNMHSWSEHPIAY